MLADFPGEVRGEMESGFTLGKWGKGQESRWRDWLQSWGTGRHPEASLCCSSPGPALAALHWEVKTLGLMLTSSSQGCSQHTERPCGSCHPFFAELPQDRGRHLTKEGQTRKWHIRKWNSKGVWKLSPHEKFHFSAKLIELIYLEFWKDILWLLVLKISYKNIIFFCSTTLHH